MKKEYLNYKIIKEAYFRNEFSKKGFEALEDLEKKGLVSGNGIEKVKQVLKEESNMFGGMLGGHISNLAKIIKEPKYRHVDKLHIEYNPDKGLSFTTRDPIEKIMEYGGFYPNENLSAGELIDHKHTDETTNLLDKLVKKHKIIPASKEAVENLKTILQNKDRTSYNVSKGLREVFKELKNPDTPTKKLFFNVNDEGYIDLTGINSKNEFSGFTKGLYTKTPNDVLKRPAKVKRFADVVKHYKRIHRLKQAGLGTLGVGGLSLGSYGLYKHYKRNKK